MSLSEQEQQLLEELERNFYAAEADVVPTDQAPRQRSQKAIVLGFLAVLAGFGVILAAVAIPLMPLGVAGFVLALAGLWYALTPSKNAPRVVRAGHDATGVAPDTVGDIRKKAQSFREKMEERWNRRFDRD
ncbi:MAG: DUF3040 domain-containing protein [Microbacteriaceae bacterium]|nr:DUF3040 domain-containing protein [Microbacteriaceae bacterium]